MGRLQGWGGLCETPEKLEGRSPSSEGWVLLAQQQVTSSLVLGKEKPVGEEDGGKLRGFIWMAFIFPVSVMGEELNPTAPWYGSSSDAGRGHRPWFCISSAQHQIFHRVVGKERTDNSE